MHTQAMSHVDSPSPVDLTSHLPLLLNLLIVDHSSPSPPATYDIFFPARLLSALAKTASPSAGIGNSKPIDLTSWHPELLQARSFPVQKCPDFGRRMNARSPRWPFCARLPEPWSLK